MTPIIGGTLRFNLDTYDHGLFVALGVAPAGDDSGEFFAVRWPLNATPLQVAEALDVFASSLRKRYAS
jgi:hypothetical protein